LTPAIEVRILAPELCTGRQVARHASAKRGTWVRFPPGARSLRRVLPAGEETGFSLRKRGFDSRTRYSRQRQCPGRRIGPDATNVGGVVQLHAGVLSLGGGARCAACFGYRTLGWFDSSRLDHDLLPTDSTMVVQLPDERRMLVRFQLGGLWPSSSSQDAWLCPRRRGCKSLRSPQFQVTWRDRYRGLIVDQW
jgi:hypothetical protein